MASFNGPWSSDLDSFKKSVQSMPEQYKASFSAASKATLDKICDPNVLHVWGSDSDIDNLLQLTSVIAKQCNLGVRKNKGANATDSSMLIIAEESKERNNFGRICQLVEHLTCVDAKKHLEGTVAVFNKIVVVRGWDNSILSGQKEALEKTVKRINIAIERVLKMGGFQGDKRKVVWHHGAVVPFLLHWINTTTSSLRSTLSAITITGSLDFTSGIAPSPAGRTNKLTDLERLEHYAKKLSIPVVFLDSSSQLITFPYLGTYMYYHAYYINTFLPPSLSRPHLYKAQDELLTFAFRLRAASTNTYGSDAVRMVQKHLDARKAKHWACQCIAKENYGKQKCRAAGKDEAIHHAVQLADNPFACFSSPHSNTIPALARLAVGPASAAPNETFIAAPVTISFRKSQFRPSSQGPFYILIPQPTLNLEKITSSIQGLMMAVLELVRQEKGNPVLGKEESEMWGAVVEACKWAIGGCQGKMPGDVEKKVRFVREKLEGGVWGFALSGGDGGSGAKKSGLDMGNNGGGGGGVQQQQSASEPLRSYGFGMGSQQMHFQQAQMNNAPVQSAGYAPQVQSLGMFPQQGVYGQGQGQGEGEGQMFGGAGVGQSSLLPRQSGYT